MTKNRKTNPETGGKTGKEKKVTKKKVMYIKRVKKQKKALQKMGYKESTARIYAYKIECMLEKLSTNIVLLKMRTEKPHNREAIVFPATLVKHEKLQNQPLRKGMIFVINAETGKKVKISIKCLLEDEEERLRKQRKRRLAPKTQKDPTL